MASTIGIKIANGEFYPIMEENSSINKRLILTTVHDSQKSVQIDLYKSETKTMADALYIGSLVVEKIKSKPKGEPSVELVISSNAQGEIAADAVDLDASPSAEHQHLSVALRTLDEDSRDYDIPDFELEAAEPPPQGLYGRVTSSYVEPKTKKSFPWVLLILAGVFVVLVCLSLWFFLFRAPVVVQRQPPVVVVTPVPAESAPVVPPPVAVAPEPPAPAVTPAVPPSVIEAPAVAPVVTRTYARNRPIPPVTRFPIPAVIPPEGVAYPIRWGDTLWDISEAFYRNPLLYNRIAQFNRIRNPNLIISGTTIRIPPKN
jgi:hypothetical protein